MKMRITYHLFTGKHPDGSSMGLMTSWGHAAATIEFYDYPDYLGPYVRLVHNRFVSRSIAGINVRTLEAYRPGGLISLYYSPVIGPSVCTLESDIVSFGAVQSMPVEFDVPDHEILVPEIIALMRLNLEVLKAERIRLRDELEAVNKALADLEQGDYARESDDDKPANETSKARQQLGIPSYADMVDFVRYQRQQAELLRQIATNNRHISVIETSDAHLDLDSPERQALLAQRTGKSYYEKVQQAVWKARRQGANPEAGLNLFYRAGWAYNACSHQVERLLDQLGVIPSTEKVFRYPSSAFQTLAKVKIAQITFAQLTGEIPPREAVIARNQIMQQKIMVDEMMGLGKRGQYQAKICSERHHPKKVFELQTLLTAAQKATQRTQVERVLEQVQGLFDLLYQSPVLLTPIERFHCGMYTHLCRAVMRDKDLTMTERYDLIMELGAWLQAKPEISDNVGAAVEGVRLFVAAQKGTDVACEKTWRCQDYMHYQLQGISAGKLYEEYRQVHMRLRKQAPHLNTNLFDPFGREMQQHMQAICTAHQIDTTRRETCQAVLKKPMLPSTTRSVVARAKF